MPSEQLDSIVHHTGSQLTPTGVRCIAKLDRVLAAVDASGRELMDLTFEPGARNRAISTHRSLLVELASDLDDDLIEEMVTLRLAPIDDDASDDEIRLAYRQLCGWILGARAALGPIEPDCVHARFGGAWPGAGS
jgi:hypothetical protein